MEAKADKIHEVVRETYHPDPLPDWEMYYVCIALTADTVRQI